MSHVTSTELHSGGNFISYPAALVLPDTFFHILRAEEYTSKDKWVGGYEQDGTPVFAADEVKKFLAKSGFTLVEESEMPFLIREHRRKYQWGCSHATVWKNAN